MGLKRLSKGAVKIGSAVEMSELAEVEDGFEGTVPAPHSGAEPQRWVPSSDPALFLCIAAHNLTGCPGCQSRLN